MKVLDVKPTGKVLEIKPKNTEVVDSKPLMKSVFGETKVYKDTRILLGGSPIGLLLTLTYPEDISIQVTRA